MAADHFLDKKFKINFILKMHDKAGEGQSFRSWFYSL